MKQKNSSILSNVNVLIVEDDPQWAELLSAFSSLRGARSRIVTTLSAAISRLQEWPCEVVFLDLCLPDSVTEHTLSQIPRIRAAGAQRVILVTAAEMTTELSKLASFYGADEIVSKGCPEFTRRVEAVLGSLVSA